MYHSNVPVEHRSYNPGPFSRVWPTYPVAITRVDNLERRRVVDNGVDRYRVIAAQRD